MSPSETIGTKPKASQPRSVRSKNHAPMEDASIHPMAQRTAFLGGGGQKHSGFVDILRWDQGTRVVRRRPALKLILGAMHALTFAQLFTIRGAGIEMPCGAMSSQTTVELGTSSLLTSP